MDKYTGTSMFMDMGTCKDIDISTSYRVHVVPPRQPYEDYTGRGVSAHNILPYSSIRLDHVLP